MSKPIDEVVRDIVRELREEADVRAGRAREFAREMRERAEAEEDLAKRAVIEAAELEHRLDPDVGSVEVIEWLDDYGSDGDPITFRGQETTPRALTYDYADIIRVPAKELRISYHGEGGWKNGTLRGMLLDRIGLFAKRAAR